MIQADGVDRSGLARQLGALGRMGEERHGRDKKPRESWNRRMPFVLCGACAP
jgi:hypothetical protein